MLVSIRDEIALATGFDSVHEALSFYDLRGVEVNVRKDYSIHSLQPTAAQPRLWLNRDEDVDRLERQTAGAGVKITAFLLPNDFNARDLDRELAWVTRCVQVAGNLGVPAVRIDAIMTGEKELPLERRQAIFANAVNTILERTSILNVDLGIENHGSQGND